MTHDLESNTNPTVQARWWTGIALFLYVWLTVGFATGTVTLLGPARWITASLRGSTWSGHENRVMVAVILAYVAASFLLARLLTALIRRARTRHLRLGVPGVTTMAAVAALWGWMNPAMYAAVAGGITGGQVKAGGAEFVFGSYPNRQRLQELKGQGFAGVVSLQHPAVIPFEPPGIAEERSAAAAVGIEFVHAPMLPWVSSNEGSLETIRQLARTGRGRYYVHCGLGRDRTNVVKNMLERMGASVAAGGAPNVEPLDFSKRLVRRGPHMERGTFTQLEPGVWLIPYPNQHELYGNMLAGQVKHVMVFLDLQDSQQRRWANELPKVLEAHGVGVTVESLRPRQLARTADLVAAARTKPRPLTIVVPFTPPRAEAAVAEAVLREWGTVPQASN